MNRNRIFAAMTLALGLLALSARAQTDSDGGNKDKSEAVGRSVGGVPFEDSAHGGDQITAVQVRSGTSVNMIEFVYDQGSSKHGGGGGEFHGESIAENEYIGQVIVTSDNMVDSVTFVIYDRKTQAPKRWTERFGNDSTYKTTITAPEGMEIYGAHGQAGSKIDRLGFLYRPLLPAN
jgi:hypothetical protein